MIVRLDERPPGCYAASPGVRAADAVAVRRWDDRAKDPLADVPGFGHYRSLLEGLLVS